MAKCVNENCDNDPMKSMNAAVVNIDGDFACCLECKREYEKQRDHFFNNVVNNDDAFKNWLGLPHFTSKP